MHAGKVMIDTNVFTWKAIRQARARLNGEAFEMEQVSSLCDSLAGYDL